MVARASSVSQIHYEESQNSPVFRYIAFACIHDSWNSCIRCRLGGIFKHHHNQNFR